MKKIIIFGFWLLSLGLSNSAISSTITITLDGDMLQSGGPGGYNLGGAHFNMITTIDTSVLAYNQTSGASFDTAYYRWFNTEITFTNRPGGASDATATSNTTVRTGNWYDASANTDDMEIFNTSFSGEFSGLVISSTQIFFNADVFGADGFADIPDNWTESQLAFPNLLSDHFHVNGIINYEITNATMTTEFSAVPIPATAWLFGSGLIGLIGIARRKKHND